MTQSKKYDLASLLELNHFVCLQMAMHDAKIKGNWKEKAEPGLLKNDLFILFVQVF